MITGTIIAAVAVLLLIILLCMGYVSAPPNKAIIITGLGKQRTLIGRAGWMIPFLEKKSYLDIEQFNVDVVTSDFVPTLDFINVKADAVVKAKIGTTPDMIAAAAQNFLGWKTKDIADSVRDVLEGNLREIIGKMDLKAMVNDRQQFAEQVQDNAAPDLAKMGTGEPSGCLGSSDTHTAFDGFAVKPPCAQVASLLFKERVLVVRRGCFALHVSQRRRVRLRLFGDVGAQGDCLPRGCGIVQYHPAKRKNCHTAPHENQYGNNHMMIPDPCDTTVSDGLHEVKRHGDSGTKKNYECQLHPPVKATYHPHRPPIRQIERHDSAPFPLSGSGV